MVYGGAIPDEPGILVEILQEGVVYSYNMVEPADDFKVQTIDSELVVSGVALVRHSTELSMIMLCGESPADVSDEDVVDFDMSQPALGRERLEISPDYTVDDRYLEEAPGYARVIALVRLDLKSCRFFVRYLNQDIGHGYRVATDDPTALARDIDDAERSTFLKAGSEILARYEPLFASLISLMYLPVFFVDRYDEVAETTFSTELHARRASTGVRKAIRQLGRKSVCMARQVRCLQKEEEEPAEDTRTVVPPDLEFAASGFWKQLAPGEVGQDEEGNPIVGRTWVERTETWLSHGFAEFVVRKHRKRLEGANPGYVYIMRSGSHGVDLYKIGKTERTPEARARELTTATGVPTAFEILARWEVGDVDLVEREAHRRLRAYRVNRRREFFRAPLSTITKEINLVVAESMSR